MRYRVRGEARTAILSDAEVVIGRSSYCSLILEHASVSRIHAVLRISGEHIQVEDLGSSNGTFVNGERLAAPRMIGPGDELKIGTELVTIEVAPVRTASKTGRRMSAEASTEDSVTTLVEKPE